MKLLGLGGGIGSGKSTVSLEFARRGAVIVDADVIARQVVEPGTPALVALVEHFGDQILQADGTLDRKELATIAFSDPDQLKALNAIVHPAIGAEIEAQINAQRGTDRVVVLDAALLFDRARPGLVGSIVVDVDPEVAIGRLVKFRGFDEDDARRRVAAQMARHDRRAMADQVIDNSGSPDDLIHQVERIWKWITELPNSEFVAS